MKFTLAALLGSLACAGLINAAQPLSLDPENPHYFTFRGKPFIFLTSGEHYGAVLNLDFDFTKYLETLAAAGLNGTRTWSGAYCEPAAAFNIADNTLAPKAGRFITPWARSDQPGYANGGNKFDLSQWNPAFFKRLKEFMTRASAHGVVVEMNLFCPFYEDTMWALSPMNAANNVNGVGTVNRTNVYTLDKNGGLLAVQEQMVRKFVRELKDFDNLYYELCNEPYFGGVTLDWQQHLSQVIVDEEKTLGVRHLISQNIANENAQIEHPNPNVSIFNFHYAGPPDTVAMNYALNRVIGENETGFKGTNSDYYRMEAWDFVLAGGGLYNNLDYSFTAGHEDGTFVFPAEQPGCGNPTFRQQIGHLGKFIHEFDFVHAQPDNEIIGSQLPAALSARALARLPHECCLYLRTTLNGQLNDRKPVRYPDKSVQFIVKLPPGHYHAQWFDTKTGHPTPTQSIEVTSPDGWACSAPAFEDDIALGITKDE